MRRLSTLRPAALRSLQRRVCTSPPAIFTPAQRDAFSRDGFVALENVLSPDDAAALAEHYAALFAGEFPTGIYPDEWHWREGISLPRAFREIVNGWKSSPLVARVALAPALGRAASELMGWSAGARIAQDDVLWKVPGGGGGVGWHTDAAYISANFAPRDDNSVTIWIALDDATSPEVGTVAYAVGSHRWRRDGAASAVDSSFHGSDDPRAPLEAAAAAAGAELEVRTVPVPAGSAIFHHQDVWHGSEVNRSATLHRRALGVHLLRADCAFRAAPPPDYIYGRYYRGVREPDDHFFPVVYRPGDEESGGTYLVN